MQKQNLKFILLILQSETWLAFNFDASSSGLTQMWLNIVVHVGSGSWTLPPSPTFLFMSRLGYFMFTIIIICSTHDTVESYEDMDVVSREMK